jgi:hypothetical protein
VHEKKGDALYKLFSSTNFFFEQYVFSTTSVLKRMQLCVTCHENGSRLTKFLMNNINSYAFKLIFYENTFHN